MRIWEYTLEQLSGGKEPIDGPDGPSMRQPFVEATVVPITDNPRYATAALKGAASFADQVLLRRDNDHWVCVGSYVDDTIHIEEADRGTGIAEELFLRCAEHRSQLPVSTNFTPKGMSLLKRAHLLSVERAMRAGLIVPQEVLRSYPHLPQGGQG